MGASDNLLAALTGVLESGQRTADMFIQDALLKRRKQQDIESEFALLPRKLAIQQESDLATKTRQSEIDLERQKSIEQFKYAQELPFKEKQLGVQADRNRIASERNQMAGQAKKDKMGQIPAAQTGAYTLAQESIRNIGDVKKILFPKGTPESFNRMAAVKSNIPGSNLPLIGAVIPDVMPFSQDGQEIYRQIGEALAAKQLIKTGVVARPDETRAMTKRFMADIASNPQSAFNSLNELEQFYTAYISNLKTKGTAEVDFDSSQGLPLLDNDLDFVED